AGRTGHACRQQRQERGGRHPEGDRQRGRQVPGRRLGLADVPGQGARRDLQLRREPAAPLLRIESRAGRRRVLRRHQGIRHHLQAAHRPAGVQPGRDR
ncbi:hypothetical protein LTR94_036602, partial [Friedmanniomyces endolithicus]